MKNFQLGQIATCKRMFSASDLSEYAALAGITEELQAVPGPLLGGMFSYLLGTTLPGRGTNYLKQHLVFPRLALVGDELVAAVKVVRLRPERNLVNLRTSCANSRGEIVCEGEALVYVKDVE